MPGATRAELRSRREAVEIAVAFQPQQGWLIRISQGVPAYLKEKQVPHVWHVDRNGHAATHWRNNLWLFSRRIFK